DTQRVRSAKQFLTTMAGVEFAFSWFYADSKDIAMFSSGRLPVRAPGTDPSLPTDGTGAYDWRGFLTPAQHAQAIDPPSGVILNWNNKPAAGVGAAESNWGYGSVQRGQPLAAGSAARPARGGARGRRSCGAGRIRVHRRVGRDGRQGSADAARQGGAGPVLAALLRGRRPRRLSGGAVGRARRGRGRAGGEAGAGS